MTGELETAALGARSAAAAIASSGRAVVGIVGRDVPALLVAAADAHPFRIAPEGAPTDETDRFLGRAVDRAATLVLASVLDGSLDFLSGILLSRDTESSVRLFYTLQELHRRGRTTVGVSLVDQVHQNRESTVQFNIAQLAGMVRTLESWTSTPITEASLSDAHAELVGLRAELERMRAERRARRLAGTTALHAYRVAAALPPATTMELLRATTTEPTDAAFPLFLTGSAPLGDEVYRAVEAVGATVVGEDHDWGDPILSDELPARVDRGREQLLRDLALARLGGAPASASSTMAARASATRDGIIATGARALLSVVRPHDDAPAWDWRLQSARAGVPAVMVRGDAADDPQQIVAAVESLRAAS
ncbi:2-hydroxyacyl-CoA dehydratase family protein [Parafrigoribacterium humi]|uniref:2-hydroxyacyl-CoA dehydratase family protein n=1 Tax=Parafrigoribacterium humi TaxID=3144664 RepID=UPI0032ED9340